jgi:hypothetical protein
VDSALILHGALLSSLSQPAAAAPVESVLAAKPARPGMQFRCRFARAGRVRAAGNLPGEVELSVHALEEAQRRGLFERRAVFLDHSPADRHPSLRDLVGVTGQSRWNVETQCVEGVIRLYALASSLASLLDEILADEQQAPDVGLSLVCWPVWEAGQPNSTRVVRSIHHVESIDLVFEPAADGRILKRLSALWRPTQKPIQFKEVIMTETENPTPTADSAAQPWLQALQRTAAQAMIQASGLPLAGQQRLLAQTYPSPQAVEAAIEAERGYLAELHQNQVVRLGGTAPRGGHIQVGLNDTEKLEIALEALLNGASPRRDVSPLTGIREAYLRLSGDYEMTGVYRPERVGLANVDSSTMANMVANQLNKMVVNEFQKYPRWWEKIVSIEDFSSLQQVKWVTLGGVGELPTVSEGAAYTELTWDDQAETASFIKKGGYLGLTLEAMDKDETRRLQAAPRALAQAAWLTLGKSISAIFTANSGVGPTMSDSVALFDAAHANLGSSALSVSAWAATRTAMRKQAELHSGERLSALAAPKYLLVPPDLEISALQALGSEFDYAYALSNGQAAPENVFAEGSARADRLVSARERVIVVDLWTDANNWAAAADPLLYPSIGLGFRYGRTPEIFSVASPTAGLMFSNDTMPIKVRFFFAVGPTDYRGLYKHNVA